MCYTADAKITKSYLNVADQAQLVQSRKTNFWIPQVSDKWEQENGNHNVLLPLTF